MNIIDNLPPIIWQKIDSRQEKHQVLLITSPSAERSVSLWLKKITVAETIYIKDEKEESFELLLSQKHKGEVIYAIGGGQVVDIGRLLAFKLNKEIICVPTVLSTDAFLVNSTGLRKNNGVVYVPSKKADQVIIDTSLLQSAPKQLHYSGCADVLSIFTALSDWKLAYKKMAEKYEEGTANIANSILDSLLSQKSEIKKMSENGIKAILGGLILEVCLCNIYGNSRPEEGGEHFFCYCLENKLPHNLHGKIVFLGILITAFLQGQDWQRIKHFLDYIEFDFLPEGITQGIIIETLMELPEYVIKHKLKYSIYNTLSRKKITAKESDIKKFLFTINIQ